VEKIRIKLKAYDSRVLDRNSASIINAVKCSGAEIIGPIPLPTKIDKDNQFKLKNHFRVMDIVSATPDTVDFLMRINLPSEIHVEVQNLQRY